MRVLNALAFAALLAAPAVSAQTVLLDESFESAPSPSTYTLSGTGSSSTTGSAYFNRGSNATLALPNTNNGPFTNVHPTNDDFVVAGRNTRSVANAATKQVSFSTISVGGRDAVDISILAGANSAATYESIERSSLFDFVNLEYSLDGGGFEPCVVFDGVINEGNDPSVRVLRRDSNGDGIGDVIGSDLNETLTEYSCLNIDVSSATTLDLRVRMRNTARVEVIVVDRVRVVDPGFSVTGGFIDYGSCPNPDASEFFVPSPTRCEVNVDVTYSGTEPRAEQTLFFRLVGADGDALLQGFDQILRRNVFTLQSGATRTASLPINFYQYFPVGTYTLQMYVGPGDIPTSAFSPSNVPLLDQITFVSTASNPGANPAPLQALPTASALGMATPNPSSGLSTMRLELPQAEQVEVSVYDALGRRVLVAFSAEAPAGYTPVEVDASALPSGLYVVRAQGETFAATQRLTVVR